MIVSDILDDIKVKTQTVSNPLYLALLVSIINQLELFDHITSSWHRDTIFV